MPAVSKKQQKFMGIVRALQKGEASPKDVGGKAVKAAKTMKKSDVKDFASTKTNKLPEKKKEKEASANPVMLSAYLSGYLKKD